MRTPNKQSYSIYRTIFLPLLLLLLIESTLIIGIPAFSGVFSELNRNKENLLLKQVTTRRDVLQTAMAEELADFTYLSQKINDTAELLAQEEGVSLSALVNDSQACGTLLTRVSQDLIAELYMKRASGIFMMLYTPHPSQLQADGSCPGVYIQDQNPALPHTQLLVQRGSDALCQSLQLPKGPHWKDCFVFVDPEEDLFLTEPMRLAWEDSQRKTPDTYGIWTIGDALWYDSHISAFTYTQPLILPDGTVYGAIGVEVRHEHLGSALPRKELSLEDKGTYLLAEPIWQDSRLTLEPIHLTSAVISPDALTSQVVFEPLYSPKDCYQATVDGNTYFAAAVPVHLNGHSHRDLMLVGMIDNSYLHRFSTFALYVLGISLGVTLLVGVVGSLAVSRRLSLPIRKLSHEVLQAQQTRVGIPELSPTGIAEVDRFSSAFTQLSRDVIQTSTKFLRIIHMATGEIAGFEVQKDGQVFTTDNFFSLFAIQAEGGRLMSLADFQERMEQIHRTYPHGRWEDGSIVYRIPVRPGEMRHVRICTANTEGITTGLAEDVTLLTAERQRMEYDRDHDALTGMLNRRAFYRIADSIWHSSELGRYAAVLILDIDFLKQINHKNGHQWADRYLQQGAFGFVNSAPANSLLARLDGDTFALFTYGYETSAQLRDELIRFQDEVRKNRYLSPDESEHPISSTGGAACYPDHSTSFMELMKYADFALMQAKQQNRGYLIPFDPEAYRREALMAQNRKEFQQLLDEELLSYHFQPIFSARDGSVYAYEALMRVNMPSIKSPELVLNLARQSHRLADIERLTMFKATECYQNLLQQGKLESNAYLFLNSIADQWVKPIDQERLQSGCRKFTSQIVLEITECTDIEPEAMDQKCKMKWFSGQFALDDYGSGYNGEKNLLALSPRFVKLDICIVKGVDIEKSKQHIVSNLVSYAHRQGMLVIAEGVETISELEKCLELGVDLLQGYVLAKPAAIPNPIAPEARSAIAKYWNLGT